MSYRKRKILTTLFGLMAIIPVFFIAWRIFLYADADRRIKETAEITASYLASPPPGTDAESLSLSPEDFIDIEGLQKENPDVVGYVRVDGTGIDYPVMKTPKEPEKYLRKGFDGKDSVYGSIFMDAACYEGCMNTVLYGHRMKSGKMFAPLKNYLDAGYREEHPVIKYIDEDSIALYRVCAEFTASSNDESLLTCLIPYTQNEMKMLREYVTAANGTVYEDFEYGDELITLATCEYTNKNGRLFVIGKLINKIETGGWKNVEIKNAE